MKVVNIVVFIVLTSNHLFGSQNIDSLVEAYNKSFNRIEQYDLCLQLSEVYQSSQIDSAKLYANKALSLAKTFEIESYKGKAYLHLGDIEYEANNFTQADSIYQLAARFVGDTKDRVNIYLNIFECKKRHGKVEEGFSYLQEARRNIETDTTSYLMIEYYLSYASYFGEKHDMLKKLEYLIKAKELAVSIGREKEYLSSLNYELSIVFIAIEAYEQALEIFTENKLKAQQSKNTNRELFAFFGITSTLLSLEKYEEAKKSAFEAIELKERENISTAFGFIYVCLGEIYLIDERLDSAEYYFNKGIEISKLQNENKELGNNYESMNRLMLKKGDKEQAKFYGEQAKEVFSYIDVDLNSRLAKLYEEEMNYKAAYDLLRTNWNDWEEEENNNTEGQIVSELLKNRFEQGKLAEQKAFQEKLRTQRLWIATIILILAASMMFLVVFIQMRNNQKLKRLNASLTKRNNALQDFAYITSHDLKEPIRIIKCFSGLLERKLSKYENNVEEQEYLGFISRSATSMHEIVSSLKTYTEVSFGNTALEPVHLTEVFQIVSQNLSQKIDTQKGVLNFADVEKVKEIKFSKGMLILILQNLIENGFKYNESDTPKVDVSVAQSGQQVLFKVADNGIGIKPIYFENIFQPFKTLKNKSVSNSSGLGLAICKNIIENYGGKIWLESDESIGSRFYFLV